MNKLNALIQVNLKNFWASRSNIFGHFIHLADCVLALLMTDGQYLPR